MTGARLAATTSSATGPSLPVPDVLSAPDKWRGSATAHEVADAVASAAGRTGWNVDVAPVSDGGEGFVDVLGGANRASRVHGPNGAMVRAEWRLDGLDAFIEMARASGLWLAGGPEGNDALSAGSLGTGELVAEALAAGAERIVVGLGGSASTDGGLGCVELLKDDRRLRSVELVGACDVLVPFTAALEFASQKGASAAEVGLLAGRLERVAQIYEDDCGADVRDVPGAGAAGGLGGGLAALGARLVPGIQVVGDAIGLAERVERSDLVVTGEGRLDSHSFEGKAVGYLLELASSFGVPLLVVVGDVEPEAAQTASGYGATVVSLVERFGISEARSNTLACIEATIEAELGR